MKAYLAMTFFDAESELGWREGLCLLSRYYSWLEAERWRISSFGLSQRMRRAVTVLTEAEQADLLWGSDSVADLGVWKRHELAWRAPCLECVFSRPLERPILGPRHPGRIPELYDGLPLEFSTAAEARRV